MSKVDTCSGCDKFRWETHDCLYRKTTYCTDSICPAFDVKLYDVNCSVCTTSKVRFKDFEDNLFCSKECSDWYYFGSLHCPKCDSVNYDCVQGTRQDIEYQCKDCGVIYEEPTKKVRGKITEVGF